MICHSFTAFLSVLHWNLYMVEMRGVEPLSESIAMRTSPSADCIFYFAAGMPADGPTDLLSRWISLLSSENWRQVSCKCRLSFSCRKGEARR